MAPKDTVWTLESHTVGKHRVLRSYLNAWLPIMGFSNDRIIFIDGFAGPGVYEQGEEGSPVIALRALLEHSAKDRFRAEVVYLFIDNDERRVAKLKEVIAPFVTALPKTCRVHVELGDCVDVLGRLLDDLDEKKQQLAPAFVMLDPFGVAYTPMSMVRRLLGKPKVEIYLSFMYEAINRHLTAPEFEEHLDGLYGIPDWRAATTMADSEDRKNFLYGLYEQELRKAGAKEVTYFELFYGNRLIYAIFFATRNALGMDRMKEAIWRVDRSGDYQFRGGRGGQMALDLATPDLREFEDELRRHFGSIAEWFTIDTVEEWAQTDATDFYCGQLKSALRAMEERGTVDVDEKSRRKRKTFPSGTRIRFHPMP